MYYTTGENAKQKQNKKSEKERGKRKKRQKVLFELASTTAGTKKHTSEHQLPAERYSYPHTDIMQERGRRESWGYSWLTS